VHTLEVFLSTCGAWQRTAEQLRVHVNTLRYRLRRIEELTGRDLGCMDDRVDFHLALRLGDGGLADGYTGDMPVVPDPRPVPPPTPAPDPAPIPPGPDPEPPEPVPPL